MTERGAALLRGRVCPRKTETGEGKRALAGEGLLAP